MIHYHQCSSLLLLMVWRYTNDSIPLGGGGGGTQIWFRRGCAAEAAKPVPIFKGHFDGKGYPLLGVFIQEKLRFCVL